MAQQYDFDTVRSRRGMGASKWIWARNSSGVLPEGVVPLSVADMEFRTAPEIIQALHDTAERGMWGYTEADSSYREAVAAWMERRHGWKLEKEWILQTSGVVQMLYSAVRAFTEPGEGVIIQTPVYYPFYNAIAKNGRTILENPLKRDGMDYTMDFDDLREKAGRAKMLILCSPHNPVGRVWTRAELTELADICRENGLLVVADEIHADLVYAPHVHTAYGTLDPKYLDNCIIGTAASKTFSLAGLCCANAVVPNPDIRAKLEAQVNLDGCYTYSCFGMEALKAAYTKCEGWYRALLDYLWGNYRYFKDFMAAHFPKVPVADLQGTYLVWFDCSSFGLEPQALERFMQDEAGLFLDEGYIFGQCGACFERINLACPRAVLEGALERLLEAAKRRGIV